MAKRKPRTRNEPAKTPADDRAHANDRTRFRRHPGVWLATLSTVVGVATGMFTLRDQVFPREAGTAAAVSAPGYQQEIGRVCDEMNENDAFRARDEKAIKKRLHRATTPITQRNALLDGVQRTTSRTAHTLASFNGLEAPPSLAAVHRDTGAAWDRYVARLRDIVLSLDRASTSPQLVAALNQLAAVRPALARDSDKRRSGLERLGAANCDLEPQIVTRTFTLPRLDTDKTTGKRDRPSKTRKSKSDPDPQPSGSEPVGEPTGESTARANPPGPGSNPPFPPANPPSPGDSPPLPGSDPAGGGGAPPANPPSGGGGGGGGG